MQGSPPAATERDTFSGFSTNALLQLRKCVWHHVIPTCRRIAGVRQSPAFECLPRWTVTSSIGLRSSALTNRSDGLRCRNRSDHWEMESDEKVCRRSSQRSDIFIKTCRLLTCAHHSASRVDLFIRNPCWEWQAASYWRVTSSGDETVRT